MISTTKTQILVSSMIRNWTNDKLTISLSEMYDVSIAYIDSCNHRYHRRLAATFKQRTLLPSSSTLHSLRPKVTVVSNLRTVALEDAARRSKSCGGRRHFAKIVEVLAFSNDSSHQRSEDRFDRLVEVSLKAYTASSLGQLLAFLVMDKPWNQEDPYTVFHNKSYCENREENETRKDRVAKMLLIVGFDHESCSHNNSKHCSFPAAFFFFTRRRRSNRVNVENTLPRFSPLPPVETATLAHESFTRFGGNVKGLILDENGLDVLYWRKLQSEREEK
ncbi:unnamed protein product [Arabis nemorensis]|uniref:Uncharacterized protein n=1 Tax=Arabis nemorensis TaxID=586526 RepID=A0A565AZH6_9BRAS|nr:unnamed protein product [Arabis nemorensis]